jgi:hypothetical protein
MSANKQWFKLSSSGIPNCIQCRGQTELNGLGGITCHFCGYDSGNKMPILGSTLRYGKEFTLRTLVDSLPTKLLLLSKPVQKRKCTNTQNGGKL